MVLGTEDATPVSFWFAVLSGASVQMDDLVAVETRKPDGSRVHFYGIVDHVRTRHEGVSFDSDVQDVVAGLLPASVSYAARVLVTRVDPEDFIPPQPGDRVRHATGDSLKLALSADKMDFSFAGGLLADGQVLPINYQFVNGEQGGHINISGISGVATKTSYALFLLHSIFRGGVLERRGEGHNTRALIFNVKGEDLLFLDQPNRKVTDKEGTVETRKGWSQGRYPRLNLPVTPFRDVQFLAPPKGGSGEAIVPDVEQRAEGVTPFVFTLREFAAKRMLPYVFSDASASLNLGFVIGNIEEKLARLSAGDTTPYLTVDDWTPDTDVLIEEDVRFDEMGRTRLTTFSQLISYLEFKLLDQNDGEGDPKWVLKQNQGTLRAFVRRLRGVQKHLTPLVRGDLTAPQAERYRPDLLRRGVQTSVVDIHKLGAHAQSFVVGVLLRDLFEHKEKYGRQDTVFVVLDELNKYAPREGDSPIKDVLLDIAERGRSLGIILIGAQQTASEVERRIVSNAAIRVVGRLDLAEAERPEYRFLPQSFRGRAGILQPGTMLVSQPDVPNPVLVNYPFPAWATRKDEVDDLNGQSAQDVGEDWLR
ncbi:MULTISPECIES: ATP-binding protein [Deinococcus]|uniref:ATPase n=2 Tax=Deinococcus TaxID=1298 RepID=A0A221SZE5_9DEIO|nr:MULTISPECIES: ATP-binding protein [Deinococcus]ASN82023.1 ATPase [Deinococcus ficus]